MGKIKITFLGKAMLWLKKLLVKIIWGKDMERYTYAVATDTLNGAVAPDKLHAEIEKSIIISEQLLGITGDDVDLHCDFFAVLKASEITELDKIVAAHDGVPVPETDEPEGPISYYEEETTPTSTLDDTVWSPKISLNIDPIEYDGTYQFDFSALVSVKGDRKARVRCRMLITRPLSLPIERKVLDLGTAADAYWVPYAGHFNLDLNSGETVTVAMDFRTTATGVEVGIRDASITAVRIGE